MRNKLHSFFGYSGILSSLELRAGAWCIPVLFILLFPLPCHAFEDTIEKDVQKGLEQSSLVIKKAKEKLIQGSSVSAEVAQIKVLAEEIKIANLLLAERFKLREEKAKTLGTNAAVRHQSMAEEYSQAIEEYLSLVRTVDSIQETVDRGNTSRQETVDSIQGQLDKLKILLDSLLPKKKKPIIGNLPYKHLNYPARLPAEEPAIKPAYKGGNKTVTPDDLKDTPEAPLSKDIAALAQSLNWNPVSMYEYVKNTIETEWYFGCMKGAEETLRQKSGNDCDQAALLVALFRASGFPSRYVRGSIEFFATNGLPIERIKNLTGIDDPQKIAEHFQKAGIPYKPVIQGGKITNFQIEHIWVESQIPYANYRGVIMDEYGKTWLGLDTSIKVKGYTYNNSGDIFQETGINSKLPAIRDEYLSAVQTQTPLEYLQSSINSELTTQNSLLTYNNFLRSRTLTEEHMNILPASMQFVEHAITGEYTQIPDELIHKVRFRASRQGTASRQETVDSIQGDNLFDISIPLYRLSNQQIAVSYEPETVEDQEIINSYGGLDNTPAYLVRLRPVLKLNGERMIVATDGLPMGADYDLTIELISPNGIERTENTLIAGNLSIIGIVAQKVISRQGAKDSIQGTVDSRQDTNKDAERLLYEAAEHYIERWNKAEDELASLFHLTIARPLPAVVTVGGVIDVSYLLDMPHGFTWKGVFVDADVRVIEAVDSRQKAVDSRQDTVDREKTFMQLSSLQGSILENKIFEDDFKVESISTAKLFSIVGSRQDTANRVEILVIDKTNIDTILPSLTIDDNIKEDIANSVNQDMTVQIPQAMGSESSAISYKDWTGIGYIKENIETGESGWMLSGMIAGGMSAARTEAWLNQFFLETLSTPYSGSSNADPLSALRIQKIAATDKQPPKIVGQLLSQPLAVYVSDAKAVPVKGAKVTFRIIAGGGKIQCLNEKGIPLGLPSESACTTEAITSNTGIAKTVLTLGTKTATNPDYMKLDASDEYYIQVGLNLVSASVISYSGDIPLAQPFEAYGKPDVPIIIKQIFGDKATALPNNPAGTLRAGVSDQYDNPISNVVLLFAPESAESTNQNVPLPIGYRNVEFYLAQSCPNTYPLYGDCPTLAAPAIINTQYYGASVETILGNTVATHYTVKVSAPELPTLPAVEFNLYSYGTRNPGEFKSSWLFIRYLDITNEKDESVNASKTGTQLKAPLTSELFLLEDGFTMEGPYQCARNGQAATGYTIVPTGIMTTKKITDGNVTYTAAQGGGTAEQTQNLQNGQYQTNYTTGPTPMKNEVNAWGEATVTVPVAYYNSGSDKVITECYPANILSMKNIPLRSGQVAVFDSTTLLPIYGPATSFETVTYTVFGVDATLTIEPSINLLSDKGFTTADTTFHYTILPPEYNGIGTTIDIYKKTDQQSPETWDGWLLGDKNQGQGTSVLTAGSPFDNAMLYTAEVVLNRGTDIEIRSDKKTIPIAKVQVITDEGSASVIAKELKFSNGRKDKEKYNKRYKIEVVSKSLAAVQCAGLNNSTIRAVRNTGETATPLQASDFYPAAYPLNFTIQGTDRCAGSLTASTQSKDSFIISNLAKTALDDMNTVPDTTAVLYGGIGNSIEIEISGAKKYFSIEPLGVIVIGIDGLRQDVLYASPSYQDPTGCGGSPCHIEDSTLKGMCEILGGKYNGSSCDSTGWGNRHIKLQNVTAIFPSITLASWASIFTGKMPGETGMLGNEFFARDLYIANQPNFVPGLQNLPSGMITLDSGAFKNDSANYYGNNLLPSDFVIKYARGGWWETVKELFANIPADQRTLADKFHDSAPNRVLTAQTIYEWINTQNGINKEYEEELDLNKNCMDKECRSVVAGNHYAKGTDYWATAKGRVASAVAATVFGESEFMDGLAAEGARDFVFNYAGKGKKFPALMTVYFAGLDHEAHGKGATGGMGEYKNYFLDKADVKILSVIDMLKEKGEFDNKIFIITADHGHTGMPTELKYPRTVVIGRDETGLIKVNQDALADTSCKLKLNFEVDPFNPDVGNNNRKAELANNNLHIWELGEMMKSVGENGWKQYKILAPKEIAEMYKMPIGDQGQLVELPYGATDTLSKANVIAALNGPMAHIYLKGINGWEDRNIDIVELSKLAGYLKTYLMESGLDLRKEDKNRFPRLLASVDTILIRESCVYKIFKGVLTDSAGNITGPDVQAIDQNIFDSNKYIAALKRITGMNNPDRSGDIVLLMKSETHTTNIAYDRYTTGVSCKSWHGSLNPSDSYVPLIVAYPGGNKHELEPYINNVEGCSTTQGCDGNWRVTDIIRELIKQQY